MKNNDACLIGLDLGTSAIKGVLMSYDGQIIAEAGASTTFSYPHKGWVETDPLRHYHNVCDVLRKLSSAVNGNVKAIAMAAASGNTMLADADGNPVTPVINWMDLRSEEKIPQSLAGLESPEVSQITGWPCVNTFPLAHLAWLQENRRELYQSAKHICMDTDWLIYKLTGQWKMDHSTAATFHLQNQVTGDYHQPFLQRLEIPVEKLSYLTDSGTAISNLTRQVAQDTGLAEDTIIAAGSFDHPSAARAMGILSPEQLLFSCGTSWVGFTPVNERQHIIDAKMLCDNFLSGINGPWGGIFSVTYIGRTIEWYVDNLIAPGENDRMKIFNDFAANAVPGAGGLSIDLRQPPQAINASRGNISRAVMEGAARLINDKMISLHEFGFKFNKAVMVGGPSESPVWPGIIEDITGVEITTSGRSAGAMGAAMLAGIAAGIYADEYDAYRRWQNTKG
jgi:xylulokinase